MSTSVAFLRKRLVDLGRDDLLAGIDAGLISTHTAACEAGLIKRPPVSGNGSGNAARRRAWALLKVTSRGPSLPPKAEPQPTPAPPSPTPASPKFSREAREVIAELVLLQRADLVIHVAERRISPFQARRIAERGVRAALDLDCWDNCPISEPSAGPDHRPADARLQRGDQGARQAELKAWIAAAKEDAIAPAARRPDVRALIA